MVDGHRDPGMLTTATVVPASPRWDPNGSGLARGVGDPQYAERVGLLGKHFGNGTADEVEIRDRKAESSGRLAPDAADGA